MGHAAPTSQPTRLSHCLRLEQSLDWLLLRPVLLCSLLSTGFLLALAVENVVVLGPLQACEAGESAAAGFFDSTLAIQLESFATGVALCAIVGIVAGQVVLATVFERTALRMEALRVAGLLFAQLVLLYGLASFNLLTYACVKRSGLITGHQLSLVMRSVCWQATFPSMAALLGKVAGAPIVAIRRAVGATFVLNVVGNDWPFVVVPPRLWLAGFVFAALCFVLAMWDLISFIMAAHRRSRDSFSKSFLAVTGPVLIVYLFVFGTLCFAGHSGAISDLATRLMWPCFEVTLRLVFLLQTLVGDFGTVEAELEDALQEVESRRKAAVAANEAKREILRYLFHEIRIPLNSVCLAIEDLQSLLPDDGEPAMVLDIMRGSTSGMSKLLDDFLSLEKVEAGKLQLERESVALRSFLEHTVRAFAVPLTRKSLVTTISIDPRLPDYFFGDPHRLRQCVSNFVSNAIKFTAPGGRIVVEAELLDPTRSPGLQQHSLCLAGVGLSPLIGDEATVVSGAASATSGATGGGGGGADKGGLLFGLLRWLWTGLASSSVPSGARDTDSGVDVAFGAHPVPPEYASFFAQQANMALDAAVEQATGGELPASSPSSALQPLFPQQQRQQESSSNTGASIRDQPLWLRITVTNEGEGLTPEEQARLFKPFSQIRPGAQQNARGTGLGLAITREIVELHGGHVGVRSSRRGKTTSFFLEVPVIPAVSTSPARLSSLQSSRVQSSGTGAPVLENGARKPSIQVAGTGSSESDSAAASPTWEPCVRNGDTSITWGSHAAGARGAGLVHIAPHAAPAALTGTTAFLAASPRSSGELSARGDTESQESEPAAPLRPVSRRQPSESFSDSRGLSCEIHAPEHDPTLSGLASDVVDAAMLVCSPSTLNDQLLLPTPIAAESVGKGVKFSRVIRVASGDMDTAATLAPGHSRDAALGEAPAHRLSGEGGGGSLPQLTTAMVIDDMAANRILLARLLRRRGVGSVLEMGGGHAALAAWGAMSVADKSALQAVFCDKEMPGDLDGHDTVAQLRTAGFAGTVLGVTGNALDGDRAAFIAAGADGVICKPVSVGVLESILAAQGLALAPAATVRPSVAAFVAGASTN